MVLILSRFGVIPHPKLQSHFFDPPFTLATLGSVARKSEAPRTTRDEKRRAQHNEGRYDLRLKLGALWWDWGIAVMLRGEVR